MLGNGDRFGLDANKYWFIVNPIIKAAVPVTVATATVELATVETEKVETATTHNLNELIIPNRRIRK